MASSAALAGVLLTVGIQGLTAQTATPQVDREVMLFQDVDHKPRLLATHLLFYPRGLEHDSGTVTLMVVIDSTGVPVPGSAKVLPASASIFAGAARLTVEHERFEPGSFRGTPVNVLLQQDIKFRPGAVACDSIVTFEGADFCTSAPVARP
jgi:hypothetical protein